MIRALLAASVAVTLSGLAAMASEIPLKYTQRPLGSAEAQALWSDMEPMPGNTRAPRAHIARVDIGGGRTLTVTILRASGHCAAVNCPLRIYEGSEMLVDGWACDIEEEHGLSDDGRIMRACDQIMRTNRR